MQGIETIVQRQERVPPECDDDGLRSGRQHCRLRVLRTCRQIGDRGPIAPFGHGLLVRRENDPLDRFLTLLTPVTRRQPSGSLHYSVVLPSRRLSANAVIRLPANGLLRNHLPGNRRVASVVVANRRDFHPLDENLARLIPCRIWPIVPPSIPRKRLHHQSPGWNR